MTTLQPLRVTATMSTGIACTIPWGIALDGLLASELRAHQKARLDHDGIDYAPAMDQDCPPDLDLPLARCELDQTWHWAATCGFPDDPTIRPDVHTWTKRVDPRHLEQTVEVLPKVLSERQGRWKAHRMPVLVTPTRTLTWHAIGDPEAILELLEGIPAIGKKRAQGEGHVLSWDISPAGDLDLFTAGHLHPDGTLGRPVPTGCLADHPALRTQLGSAGIRPPYMHPSRRATAYLPTPQAAA